MTSTLDTMIVTHAECGFSGTIAAVQLHDCDIVRNGGRCEDHPCCGHTDGDGCQTLPSHTADFYYRNPHLLHEPGSPEWQDAMADLHDQDDEPPDGMDFCQGCGDTKPGAEFDNAAHGWSTCIGCRISQHVNSEPQRRGDVWRWPLQNSTLESD